MFKNNETNPTSVILTQEFFNDFEKIKKYDENYGIVVSNLFKIVKNQFNIIYESIEELSLPLKQDEKISSVLWQTEHLLNIINEKVNTRVFFEIENCVYELKKCLPSKTA